MTETKKGRPVKSIDREMLDQLIELEVPKTKIAVRLGVSRRTLYRILAARDRES